MSVSRRIHPASFAVASDGTLLVNVLELDAPEDLSGLVRVAEKQPGATFLGVSLSPSETQQVLEAVAHGHREAAAFVVGRARRARRALRRTPRSR